VCVCVVEKKKTEEETWRKLMIERSGV